MNVKVPQPYQVLRFGCKHAAGQTALRNFAPSKLPSFPNVRSWTQYLESLSQDLNTSHDR